MSDSPDIVHALDLAPHPEGGWYKETYRSDVMVETPNGPRSASTAILYCLSGDAVSKLHRIDADEVWHFYNGDTLCVACLDPDGSHIIHDLNSSNPQLVVKAGVWFGAFMKNPDTHALVGCTVAPAFEFSGLELANRQAMHEGWPEADAVIRRLT